MGILFLAVVKPQKGNCTFSALLLPSEQRNRISSAKLQLFSSDRRCSCLWSCGNWKICFSATAVGPSQIQAAASWKVLKLGPAVVTATVTPKKPRKGADDKTALVVALCQRVRLEERRSA